MRGGEMDQETDEVQMIDRGDAKRTRKVVVEFAMTNETDFDLLLREEIGRKGLTNAKRNRKLVDQFPPHVWHQETDFSGLQTTQQHALLLHDLHHLCRSSTHCTRMRRFARVYGKTTSRRVFE